ncbi:MAG: hypothetical protein LUE17_13255 [Planctomycetaceae bacterium]|nr:hypothetical protein [Planctomycetaceae bacterium]
MKRITGVAALAFAACGLFASAALAEDIDVKALSAKLAAQEAALRDFEARMMTTGSEPNIADGITSLRKNATVTIGGLVTTGVYAGNVKRTAHNGNVFTNGLDPELSPGVPNPEYRQADRVRYKGTSMELSDAELYVQIDVNDYFDAFLMLDLHNVGDDAADNFGLAKSYYVRWKNICETGFGLKVGRDAVAFGDDENAMGYLDGWAAGGGDGMDWWSVDELTAASPAHNGWKHEGVTQITPYWEGLDGALKMELTIFQNLWNENGDGLINSNAGNAWYWKNGGREFRSRNYAVGSGAFRVQYSPIEDLTFTAGVINFRSDRWVDPETNQGFYNDGNYEFAKNNTAVNLAFRYTPCFFDRLTIWSQWVHGWNVDHLKDYDSDVVNFGASLNLTDSLIFFAQGDYLRAKDDQYNEKHIGWAAYTGLSYELPVGAVLEAGWRHERVKVKTDGVVTEKVRANMLYANLGFEF